MFLAVFTIMRSTTIEENYNNNNITATSKHITMLKDRTTPKYLTILKDIKTEECSTTPQYISAFETLDNTKRHINTRRHNKTPNHDSNKKNT